MSTRANTIVFDLGNGLIGWEPRALYRKLFDGREQEIEWFLGNVCTLAWNLEQDRVSLADVEHCDPEPVRERRGVAGKAPPGRDQCEDRSGNRCRAPEPRPARCRRGRTRTRGRAS